MADPIRTEATMLAEIVHHLAQLVVVQERTNLLLQELLSRTNQSDGQR